MLEQVLELTGQKLKQVHKEIYLVTQLIFQKADTESSFTAKIQGGVILDNTHRISLAYAPAFNSDANVHNVMAGYDYLIPVNNEYRVYVGAHLGSTVI